MAVSDALRAGPGVWLRCVVGGATVMAMAVAFVVSFAAIVYKGPLTPFLADGIGLTLLGASLLGVVGAFSYSYRGTICQPQDITAILIAGSVAALAADWPEQDEQGLFATTVMLVVTATLLAGLVAYLFGRLRLGFLARFVPYPVIGGFLAATGVLLLQGATGMALGTNVDFWNAGPLLETGDLHKWVPWLAVGAGIALATRMWDHDFLLPGLLLAAGSVFYALLGLTGMDLAEAQRAGLLLGPFEADAFLQEAGPSLIGQADWGAVLSQAPALFGVAGLTILGTLLNSTGLEVTLGRDVDLERDLRATGLANIVASTTGGLVGFQLLGETVLARKLGLAGPIAGLSAAAGCLAALVFGAGALSVLPVGLFAAVIAYLGFDLLITWLWSERRRLSVDDFALVLLILVVAAVAGFIEALGIGLLVAVILFIISYARIDVVRLRSTAASRRSLVERSGAELDHLAQEGRCAVVLELSGYLFFGTANGLLERIRAELTAELRPRYIVLDFGAVQGLDGSAVFSLQKLSRLCAATGVRLLFSGLSPKLEARLLQNSTILHEVEMAETMNEVLESIEEALLASTPTPPPRTVSPLLEHLQRLAARPGAAGLLEKTRLSDGEVLLREGVESAEIFVLLSGVMRAEISGKTGKGVVVARFLPGALIGEIAYYAGVARTATVVAEGEAELLKIDPERLADRRGDEADSLHRYAAGHLARRVMRMTQLVRDAGL